MTEKFHRNVNLPYHEDFAKTTFFPTKDKITIIFHVGTGNLINPKREFRKSQLKSQTLDMPINFVVDPLIPKKPLKDIYSQFLHLVESEKLFYQDLKRYDQEFQDVNCLRGVEESEGTLLISIHDTVRNVAQDGYGLDVEGRSKSKQQEISLDYLAPYLFDHVPL
jgi:hypothetical protein